MALGSSASIASAETFSRLGGDKQRMIDATVDFIFGGIFLELAEHGIQASRTAAAMFASASSRICREVPMFMRMQRRPPLP